MYGNIPQDTVSVELTVEKFVTSDSVKLELRAVAVIPDDSFDAKAKILEALEKVSPGAEWYFTAINRVTSNSGQDEVHATVQTRLEDKKLNGIKDRIEAAGYKGLKITQSGIDYSPRKAQLDEETTKLRSEAYAQAVKQVEALNAVIKDGVENEKWRVGTIEFGGVSTFSNARVGALESTMYAAAAGAKGPRGAAGPAGDSMELTQKLTLAFTVHMVRRVYSSL